jgi:hypothetical protein
MTTTTMLDPRSRPTTAEERAKAYALPNPVLGRVFDILVEAATCDDCLRELEPGSLVWDQKEEDLGTARFCDACTKRAFGPAIAEYMNERRQCNREAELEVACLAEAEGRMQPDNWFTIAEANLGYVAPEHMTGQISIALDDYGSRFGYDEDPKQLEQVRAMLWAMVPTKPTGLGAMRVTLEPEGPAEVIGIDNGDKPGTFRVNLALDLKVVIR